MSKQHMRLDSAHVACHLCDSLVTLKHKLPGLEAQWLTKCSESLAQLLDIEEFGPSFFDSVTYCHTCVALIADVDFSVRTAASLASRLSSLRTQIAAFLLKRFNLNQQEVAVSDEFSDKSQPLLCTDENFKVKVEESLGNCTANDDAQSEGLLLQSTRILRSRTRIVFQDDCVTESDCDDRDISNHGEDDDWTHPPSGEETPHLPNIHQPPKKKRKIKSTSVSSKRCRTEPTSTAPSSERIRSYSKISKQSIPTEKELLEKMKSVIYFWKSSDEEVDAVLLEFVRNSLSSTLTADGLISEELLVHLLRSEIEEHHQLLKTYICTESGCPARFRNVVLLTQHLLIEHGMHLDPSPYQCFVCPALFSFGTSLDAHLRRTHAGDPRPFHCEVSGCFKEFLFNKQLAKHMQLNHPDVEPEMGIGSEQKKYNLYRDMEAIIKEPFIRSKGSKCPRKLPCTQIGCHYRAHSERILCFHLLEHHRDIDAQPYVCDGCGKGFKKRRTYNIHPCVKAGIQCEECGKVFRKILYLTRHKKLRHKDAATFRCSVCARPYIRQEDVAAHEKLHTPATAFNCVILLCENSSFDSLGDLRAHVAGPSHDLSQGVKVCDLCGYVSKGVKCADRMKDHMRTHTGEEPLKCRYCDKRFKTHPTRTSHEQINHPDLVEKKVYACKQCDATFTVAQYLFKHNAWHKYGKNACRPVAKKR